MNANLLQTDFLSDATPGAVQHPLSWLALVSEYIAAVISALGIHNRLGNVIQDDQSVIAVLYE